MCLQDPFSRVPSKVGTSFIPSLPLLTQTSPAVHCCLRCDAGEPVMCICNQMSPQSSRPLGLSDSLLLPCCTGAGGVGG